MKEFNEVFKDIFPFWDTLESSDKDLLNKYSTNKFYFKGDNVHGGDGECTGAIVVKSGCLRSYMLSPEGKEITLYRLYKGDICMLSASCVLQSITFDVRIDAEEESECLIVSGKILSEISEKNIYVKTYALEIAVERFSDVMWTMQQILFMSFDRRLAIFLHDEKSKSGDNIIRLSNEQIAKYVGSAREVVSRMLKYFKSEGIAERTSEGVVILNPKKLNSLI